MNTFRTIPERDWKVFRELRQVALERLCERILAEAKAEIDRPGKTAHEKYLSVFKLVDRRNDDVARAFDDFRRSTAWLQIGTIHSMGLLTEDELKRFSPETLQAIAIFSPNPES